MCHACARVLPIRARHFCAACYNKRQRFGLFRRRRPVACRECAAPLTPHNSAHGRCGACRKRAWRMGR
jgi:hypothetical protein